jgi:4-carboxymuconolactone decarboxylase
MARIPQVERDSATPEQRRVGDLIFGSREEDYQGPSAIVLHLPDLAERFEVLRNRLVREQRLPGPMVNLAALITARFWDSEYTWWKRVDMCRKAGIGQDAIDAVRERRTPTFGDPALAAVHDYARELLETRRVSEETHRRVKEHLDDEQLIELVMVIGFYSMLALVSDAFEPDFPEDVTAPFEDA